MTLPDIAMCWDGRTNVADLRVDGRVLPGDPAAVEYVFRVLNEMRDRLQADELRRTKASDLARDLVRALGPR